jgi:site-specific DNA recombinase
LGKLGLINRTSNPLSASQVQQLLTDPFYYGAFKYNGELYQGTHKAAITKSLWDEVQTKMRNRGKPKTFKKHNKYFAFRGLLTCAECGRSITPETQKHNNYYHCTRRLESGYCTPYVNEKELTSQFEAILDSVALPDDWIELMLAELVKLENTRESRLKARLAKLDDELDVIQARLSRLADLYISHEIDRADYTARKAVLVNQKISNAEARKELANDRGSSILEPARRPLKLVWDLKNAPAGDDLGKLRDYVARVVSNLTLNSRNVLWDWTEPFGLLSKSAEYTDWLGSLDSNQD